MKDRSHDEAMAELFKEDPAFAAEYLNQLLHFGEAADLLVAQSQIAQARLGQHLRRKAKKQMPGEQAGHFKDHHQLLTDQPSWQQEAHKEQLMSHHTTDSERATLFPLGRSDEPAGGNILASAVQPDLFVVLKAIHDWPVKDDVSSMEYPIFSLSKNRDTRIRVYSRAGRSIRIIPSAVGAATVFDKDILIYCISQIVRGHDAGIKVSRRVRVDVYPFLLGTRRSTGGAAYERVVDMCRRLKGTTIETNVKTNEKEQLDGFGLIEDYRVTTWTKNGKGALELELTISEWLYRAALDFDILTLHPDYFSLGQALGRRLYELARKHCGDKAWWEIRLPLLLEKTGSSQSLRRFKQEIKEIVERGTLPDYHLFLDESAKPNKLVVMTRDNAKLACEANKAGKLSWVSYFLQKKLY